MPKKCHFCKGTNDVREIPLCNICADCVISSKETEQEDGTILVTLYKGWETEKEG